MSQIDVGLVMVFCLVDCCRQKNLPPKKLEDGTDSCSAQIFCHIHWHYCDWSFCSISTYVQVSFISTFINLVFCCMYAYLCAFLFCCFIFFFSFLLSFFPLFSFSFFYTFFVFFSLLYFSKCFFACIICSPCYFCFGLVFYHLLLGRG